MLGLSFALVRQDLVCPSPLGRKSDRVFVGLGASDVLGMARPIAHALAGLGHEVLLAPGALVEAARGDGGAGRAMPAEVRIVSSATYVEALRSSSVAVIGAGSSMWETAAVGLPAIAVVVAANQEKSSVCAHELGFIERIGMQGEMNPDGVAARASALLADQERCSEMARLGVEAVDGGGAGRVVGEIVNHVVSTGASGER